MSESQDSIGLTDLLDEVDRDLDGFRKKHAGDYSMKNITLWWELERERVLVRHLPGTVVKTQRRTKSTWRLLALFTAGWLGMMAVQTVIRLLVG